MKAKVLVSFYPQESGFAVHRIYFEPHFKQAELDFKLLVDESSSMKQWELQDVDIYNWESVKAEIIKVNTTFR